MTCEAFPLPLDVSVAENGRTVHLLSPVIYVDPDLNLVIEVPAGFETDFNSTPRLVWWFLSPWEFPKAPVVHDWLYRNGLGRRKEADDIYRKALMCLGCPEWKANLVYSVLRVFGSKAWAQGVK